MPLVGFQIVEKLLDVKPDITFAGSEAMDSMSMERGFVHWHGDIDYTDKGVHWAIIHYVS